MLRHRAIQASSLALALTCAGAAMAQSPAAQRGQVFVRTHCAQCHSIDKVTPSPLAAAPAFRTLHRMYPVEISSRGVGRRHRDRSSDDAGVSPRPGADRRRHRLPEISGTLNRTALEPLEFLVPEQLEHKMRAISRLLRNGACRARLAALALTACVKSGMPIVTNAKPLLGQHFNVHLDEYFTDERPSSFHAATYRWVNGEYVRASGLGSDARNSSPSRWRQTICHPVDR